MTKIHESLCKLFSEYYGLFYIAGFLTSLFSVWPIGIGISPMTEPEWSFLTWKTGCFLYGLVNLVTAFIALCAISPGEFEYNVDWEDRFDKLLKPLIIFFPLLLILWGFILVTCICFWFFMCIYKMYKRVEEVIFGE